MWGLVRGNFWYFSESIKKTLYLTLIWPKLDYAAVAWDPHFKCDIVRLEGVQRASACFYTNDCNWFSSVTSITTVSFLNPTVRKMCSKFPFSQDLLKTGISSPQYASYFVPWRIFRTTFVNFLKSFFFYLLLYVILLSCFVSGWCIA